VRYPPDGKYTCQVGLVLDDPLPCNEKPAYSRFVVHFMDVSSIAEEFDVVLAIAAFTLAINLLMRDIALQLEAVEGF
jgi:hypothetical protein